MQDIKLYEAILGLSAPWEVKSIELDKKAEEVIVEVECKNKVWICPESNEQMHMHGYEERKWRHLDSCQYKTIIKAKVPRVKNPGKGTMMVQVPWAESNSRFTLLFERFAIDLLLSASVKATSKILRVSWDEASGIKRRAVQRGLARNELKEQSYEHLCIDEKSYGRGHKYLTFVATIKPGESGKIVYIGDERKEDALDGFWAKLSKSQKEKIQSISMDMWKPFMQSVRANISDADNKVVHDRFHIIGYMNEAVNKVRQEEHTELFKQGDTRLKGTKYHWLYGAENRPPKIMENWEKLKVETLKTAKAWSIKEILRNFWKLDSVGEAESFFKMWYGWAMKSRLEPVKKVAKMIKRHLKQVINYFKYRVTNGPIEGLNNKVQAIVKKAYGHRNISSLKTDILFHLGGLDLYPTSHAKA